jgi:uncharacterized membrane protein
MKIREESTLERVNAFSDGVFAIIITIMVLELKKPENATFHSLFQLWPTWISYAASYLFIAIVWVNHHYLLKHASSATQRLLWANFGHLFSVSMIPFLTTWVAETILAPIPVALYALVFFLVNITYLALVWEILCDKRSRELASSSRRLLNVRSFITLSTFLVAAGISFWWPYVGFVLVCCCLLLYLKPELPGMKMSTRTMIKRTQNLRSIKYKQLKHTRLGK